MAVVVELAGNLWSLGVLAWVLWVAAGLAVQAWLPPAITDDADREVSR